jgi:hypothetical protein
MMPEPFRWTNCHADVLSWRYRRTAQAFLDDVIEPALNALDVHVLNWSESDEAFAAFVQSDAEELLQATNMAFCLSTQAMWERQIRKYLCGCAQQLTGNADLARRCMRGSWNDLNKVFFELRGIHLSDFAEYRELDLLHQLGNACRHGDGPSAQALWHQNPELWPSRDLPSFSMQGSEAERGPQSIDTICIPRDMLRRFVGAIVSFWEEAEYIYLESLERKHESVVAKLMILRREREFRSSRRGIHAG